MDLLLSPVSGNMQRTGSLFTVRSANSPSYSLTRRPGIRKAKALSEDAREGVAGVEEIKTNQKQTGRDASNEPDNSVAGYPARTGRRSFQVRYKEMDTSNKLSTSPDQNGTSGETITGANKSLDCNPASETRGRTAWRRYNLPSRSKSLDWRTGATSPDRGNRAPGISAVTRNQRVELNKHDRNGTMDTRASGMSSVKTFTVSGSSYAFQERSPNSQINQNVERISTGHSLPFRLRSTETASADRLKRGQSILERIEKLYANSNITEESSKMRDFSTAESDLWKGKVHAAMLQGSTPDDDIVSKEMLCERAAGGTFPRRFSLNEKSSSHPPVRSRKSFTCTPQKVTGLDSDNSFSRTGKTREVIPEGQWHDQSYSSYSEQGGFALKGRLVEIGTRSLDRARSKNTVACQLRLARATKGTTTPQSNVLPAETVVRDLSGAGTTHGVEKIVRINETSRDKTCLDHDRGGGAEHGVRGTIGLRANSIDEDVFETNLQSIQPKTGGTKSQPELVVPSTDSVRNKINQFEALTQKAHGLSTSQVQMPRRAFSVPSQLNNNYSGVRKSGSAKAIVGGGNNVGELKDGRRKVEEIQAGSGCVRWQQRGQTERSLSVDEVRSRMGNKGIDLNDLKERKDMDSGYQRPGDFGDNSRLTHATEVNTSPPQRPKGFYIDEADWSKVSRLQIDKDEMDTSTIASAPSKSSNVTKTTPAAVIPSASDNDRTPTNTPKHSPFHSSQTEIVASFAAAKNAQDPAVPLRPPTTSSDINPRELITPSTNTALPKGPKQVLDLNAWVAGWKSWKDDKDLHEEDDGSTQKDEDSNYDSDSGESSVTITSNRSQSDRRSFSVSLADLCNFTGGDYESDNDSDEWQSTGRRSASLSSDVSALSYVSVLPSEELDRLMEDVRSLGDSALQDDVQVVVLHKEVGVGLGFSMAGGVDQNKPVTVHKVFHTGVAAQEGSIQEGDQVLSINGTALCAHSHWEALRVLRRAKTREMGVVVLRRGSVISMSKDGVQTNVQEPARTRTTETGQRLCVRLEKNSRDLGFSLEGGAGLGNRPLTVQKIFQGGPVDKVCPGDELVEIDGVNIVGMRRLEAWTLIRGLPAGPVDVVLCRPQKHPES